MLECVTSPPVAPSSVRPCRLSPVRPRPRPLVLTLCLLALLDGGQVGLVGGGALRRDPVQPGAGTPQCGQRPGRLSAVHRLVDGLDGLGDYTHTHAHTHTHSQTSGISYSEWQKGLG